MYRFRTQSLHYRAPYVYMMRPQIPDSLTKRIEAIYEKAGYSSKTDLVNDSVRRRVEELEEHFDIGE